MGKHLVFVGGGHAHLTALLHIEDYLQRGHRVTLISPAAYHYYSGMGPGMLAGTYGPQQVRFHIKKMAESRGAVFVEDKVRRVDAGERVLFLQSGGRMHYDVASFNTGSEVPVAAITTPDNRIVPVKPIINLYTARSSILHRTQTGTLNIPVIGGGAAGVEVAANLRQLVGENDVEARITLVGGTQVLGGFPDKVRRLAAEYLAARDIQVLQGVRVTRATDGRVALTDGNTLPYDFVFVAVGVKPSELFRESGLPTADDGGLLVNDYLQCVEHPELFGGGDCISLSGQRLARVGVYAVRQNPVLHHNLLAALEGERLRAFSPGGDYLLILNMGAGRGILWKHNWLWHGRLAFLLKDYIDRRFMKKFQVSGELNEPLEQDPAP